MKDVEKKEFGDQLGVGRGREKKNTTNNLKLVFLSIIFIYFFLLRTARIWLYSLISVKLIVILEVDKNEDLPSLSEILRKETLIVYIVWV